MKNEKILTEEELTELKSVLETITAYIPEHQLGYIWNNYNKLKDGKAGPQPCACSSAAKYWKAAVDELRAYVKSNG